MKCIFFILVAIISQVDGQSTSNKNEYSEAEDKIMLLERVVLALDSRLESSENVNDELRVRLNAYDVLEERLSASDQQIVSLEERLSTAEEENADLREQVITLQDTNAEIAFTAYAPPVSIQYNHADKIIFPYVILNLGSHYNTSTSTFTCPVDGTYLFAVNFISANTGSMQVHIMKDMSYLVRGIANEIEGGLNTGSAMVIIACRAQEQVWVRSNGDGYMFGYNACTFAGALLAIRQH